MEGFVWIGTELKYLVEITAGGFSMADDDFNITLTRGNVTKVVEKSELVTDSDFSDGLRIEVFKTKLTTIQS